MATSDENKIASAKPTSAPKAPAPAAIAPVVALHWVNFKHLPDTIFVPASETERTELLDLEAVRELTDAELLVFKAQSEAAASDVIG